MKQIIRIIGGLYRGKKIQFPVSEGLRPTPDRVRETLFNWLMQDIREARCLDAFAGSGAIGLEAFSRGASHVSFIEHAPTVHAHLRTIINSFNSPKLELIKANTLTWLEQCKTQYHIIFLDPPFAEEFIHPCLNTIVAKNLLLPGGLVYIESSTIIEAEKSHWKKIKEKQAGLVVYALFEKV